MGEGLKITSCGQCVVSSCTDWPTFRRYCLHYHGDYDSGGSKHLCNVDRFLPNYTAQRRDLYTRRPENLKSVVGIKLWICTYITQAWVDSFRVRLIYPRGQAFELAPEPISSYPCRKLSRDRPARSLSSGRIRKFRDSLTFSSVEGCKRLGTECVGAPVHIFQEKQALSCFVIFSSAFTYPVLCFSHHISQVTFRPRSG
jgi:hypothetical protein